MQLERAPLREDRPPRTPRERKHVAEQREWIKLYKRVRGCRRCSSDKRLSFHHRDPRRKRFNIGDGRYRSWSALEREVAKCIVLCKKCHAQEHGL